MSHLPDALGVHCSPTGNAPLGTPPVASIAAVAVAATEACCRPIILPKKYGTERLIPTDTWVSVTFVKTILSANPARALPGEHRVGYALVESEMPFRQAYPLT